MMGRHISSSHSVAGAFKLATFAILGSLFWKTRVLWIVQISAEDACLSST